MTQTHKEEMKKSIFSIIAMVFISFVFMHDQLDVYAADAAISFKESQYIVDEGDEIEIQVNINADGNIGYYEVKLRYDNTRMTYISGAEEEKDGILTLQGTGWGKEVDYENLKFKAVSGGNAGIAVQEAHIYSNDGDVASYSVSSKPTASVNINGDDHGENSFFDQLLEEESVNETQNIYGIKTDKPVVGCINKDGENYYILDITDYEPQISLWNYTPVTGSYMKRNITYISDKDCNVNVLLIMDADENQSMIAYNTETSQYYAVHELQDQGSAYYVMSVLACKDIPNQMTEEEISSNTVCYAIGKDGSGGYCRYTKDGTLKEWKANENIEKKGVSQMTISTSIIVSIIVTTLFIITVLFIIYSKKSKRKIRLYNMKFSKKRSTNRKSLKTNNSKIEERKQYFFVIRELTGREIKRKYARSYLGIVWSILNPLLMMTVMSMIFSFMFQRSIECFPLYLLTGSIFWNMFNEGTNHAMSALVDNKNLLIKSKLPRKIFIISRMFTALVNFMYSCVPYVLMLIVFKRKVTIAMLLFPFDVVLLFIFSLGIGYILSILYVFFADIKYLYGVFLRILMYMTALFYPVSSLPEKLQTIIGLNPVYLAIYIARESMVYGRIPHYSAWIKLALASIISLIVGRIIFLKKQNDVMQRI